jgi:hypothetical protein
LKGLQVTKILLPINNFFLDLPEGYKINKLGIFSTSVVFDRSKAEMERKFGEKSNATGFAVNWSFPNEHEVVIAGAGKKMGATTKNWDSPKMRSTLCKKELLMTFAKTAVLVSKTEIK